MIRTPRLTQCREVTTLEDGTDSTGWNIRSLGIFFFVSPLAAMLIVLFFEALFDVLERDTEDLGAPMAWGMTNMTSLPLSWLVSMSLIGISVGIWMHFLALRYDRTHSAYAVRLGQEAKNLCTEISIGRKYL